MATRRDLFEIEAQVPRGTLVYLSPERIEPNPHQPRQQLSRAGLEELKASIAARGILQALLGVRGDNGRVILIAGHRRWQAAKELGLARVPVILVDNRNGKADALVDAIIENVQRENLAPWEEGESYRQLATEFGWEHKQIASSIGKSRPYVTQRIRAAENLAPAVKEFFLTGDESVLYKEVDAIQLDDGSTDVTAVTPNYKFHNTSEDQKVLLASFLNNVELVRRLTALEPEIQIKAIRQSIIEAYQQDRLLTLVDLTTTLKNYRDLRPSPKARLKNQKATGYTQLSFDLGELEVVRWSAQGIIKKPTETHSREWELDEVDRLITRYESDLERLRHWREQQKSQVS